MIVKRNINKLMRIYGGSQAASKGRKRAFKIKDPEGWN